MGVRRERHLLHRDPIVAEQPEDLLKAVDVEPMPREVVGQAVIRGPYQS